MLRHAFWSPSKSEPEVKYVVAEINFLRSELDHLTQEPFRVFRPKNEEKSADGTYSLEFRIPRY